MSISHWEQRPNSALTRYEVYSAQMLHCAWDRGVQWFTTMRLLWLACSGPVSLLSGLNPRPRVLVMHFFAVAIFGVGRLLLPRPTLRCTPRATHQGWCCLPVLSAGSHVYMYAAEPCGCGSSVPACAVSVVAACLVAAPAAAVCEGAPQLGCVQQQVKASSGDACCTCWYGGVVGGRWILLPVPVRL